MSNFPSPLPDFSAQMIMELAAKIQEPKDILERYEVSPEDFKKMSAQPTFKKAYAEAKRFWDSDANVRDRIATKAAVLVEDALLDVYTLFKDTQNAGAKMDAFKTIMKLAKVDGGEQKVENPLGSGQAININIDMGAKVVSTTLENIIEGELADEQ